MYGVKGQTVEVNNSIVRLSGGEGIRADGGSLVLKKSRVEKCSGWSVVAASCSFDIDSNTISENGGGIKTEGSVNGVLSNISQNEILNNGSDAIANMRGGSYSLRWQIVGNLIQGNSGVGFLSESHCDNVSFVINKNRMIGNAGILSVRNLYSQDVSRDTSFVFTENTLSNNKGLSGNMMSNWRWFNLEQVNCKVVIGGNVFTNSGSVFSGASNWGHRRRCWWI